MASLIQKHSRYSARVRIPKHLTGTYGNKKHLQRSLGTSDKRLAKVEADAWEAALRLEWSAATGNTQAEPGTQRHRYLAKRADAERGAFQVFQGDSDPAALGIEFEIDRIADAYGQAALPPSVEAELAGLNDGLTTLRGRTPATRREFEPSFSEIATEYVDQWKRQRGLKPSNTEQQKRATYALFAGYWTDRPMREIRETDAVAFSDALRRLDPSWGRKPKALSLSWAELQSQYGQGAAGLSDATMNRHTAALKALWEWSRRRGHCTGDNPFDGFHKKLTSKNTDGYLAWSPDQLRALFSPPPKRRDLHEIMVIALYSGMRLNEIASLTGTDIRTEEGVTYFDIQDAKTEAGNRQVPLHPALAWLATKATERGEGRLWPTFNAEGPGAKPGADAGREFSRFKAGRGFPNRRNAFHSFRKNVTRIMERGGIPESEWAQVIGHERGFTFGVYNPDGIALERKLQIIKLIKYPGHDFGLING